MFEYFSFLPMVEISFPTLAPEASVGFSDVLQTHARVFMMRGSSNGPRFEPSHTSKEADMTSSQNASL